MPARTLLIEDNPANLLLMTELLRARGYEPLYAKDGETGLALAQSERPDVVVCDIQLPRMDGFEVLRRLKSDAATGSIPVIAVTACSTVDGRDRALAAGFDGYIGKPIVPETFVLQFEQFLRPQVPDLHCSLANEGCDVYDMLQRRAAELQLAIDQRKRAEQALSETQAQYRSVFQNSVVGIYVVDAHGRAVSVNPALVRILGYESSAEMMAEISSVAKQVYAAEVDRSRFHELIRSKGVVEGFETRWRRKDGSLIWVSLSARLVDDPAISHIGMAEDITERKRAEQLRALEHGITRCLAGAESASAVLQSVIRTICEAEEWPCGRYFTADEAAGVLRFAEAWSSGHPAAEAFIARSRGHVYKRGEGLSGTAWQTGRPLWVADVTKDARASGSSRSAWGPSLQGGSFVLPVRFEGKTLGVLSFSSAAAREPDERFLQATGVISSQVGQFLARMQAETAMRNSEAGLRRAQLMAKLAHVVTLPGGEVESWSETFPQLIGTSSGDMVHSTRDWLEILHPEDHDAFRQTSIEAAASGTRRHAEYRLQRGNGEWVHVRHVMEPMQSHPRGSSSARWFNTLQDITEQTVAEKRIRRLNRVYAVLSSINSLIVRVRQKDELLREACRVAVEVAEFRLAWIGIVDEQKQEIMLVASSGADQDFLRVIRLSTNDDDPERFGMAGRAIRDHAPVVSNEVATDPLALRRTQGLSRGFLSVAMLPLVVSGQAVGVLGLHAAEAGVFDHEEMNLLGELASDIAFALEHLEKEEKLRRLTRVNAVLSGINAAIVRIRNRQELFQEACRIAVEEGQFPVAWIGVVDRVAACVKPVAWQGTDERILGQIRMGLRESAPGGIGVVGRAVNERAPVISNDLEHDPQVLVKGVLEHGARSLAVLPVGVGSDACAVLVLYAPVVGFFDGDEMKLLLELAGDLAFALDHIDKAEKLDYLAYYDALTGLANRTLLHERLGQHVSTASAEKHRLALVIIDIERFKTINDSLGRHVGDELLKQVAGRMTQDSPDIPCVARIGADHFALLVPQVRSEEKFGRLAEARMSQWFGTPYRLGNTDLRVSARAGVAMFPDDADDAESLFKNAEAALKKAKAGGERYLFYTQQMTERVAEKLALESKLRQALEREEFVLHYQPKVDLEKRGIVGLEALIRWQSPELGLVPPGQFIPLLEETGLILQVGAWALNRAARDHRSWTEQKLEPPRVSVNVSAIQLRQRDFVSVVEQAIIDGVAPTGIDLEITESLIMEDIQGNIAKLNSVRALGVKIAIDDFGTGYSSLGYLAKLPVQALKIDRSFIANMHEDADAMSLISTIISLAHSLRLSVIAEGVETEEQAKFLRLLRCDEMQGYLYSKALPFAEISGLLKRD